MEQLSDERTKVLIDRNRNMPVFLAHESFKAGYEMALERAIEIAREIECNDDEARAILDALLIELENIR